jgi:hypothetical protein
MRARLKAFALHLVASCLLALLMVALVFLVWYPAPLHLAIGVTGIFFLILGVDVVIGPVLTFVVYKVGKKTLKFDLAVIVCLQLAAFGYGLWTVAQGRPAWLVFNVDRFDVARAIDLDDRHLARTPEAYRRAPLTGPGWVASRVPTDIDERNTLTFESTMGGVDLPQRIDLYLPLAQERASLLARAKPLAELGRFNPPEAVSARLAPWPQADAWLPLMASQQAMVVLLAKGEVLGMVDLRPWD